MYEIAVKSGTNGYYDCDSCDMVLAKIQSNNIPRIGEKISLSGDGVETSKQYLVMDVKYDILIPNETSHYQFGEWIKVYVIDFH